MTSRQEHYISTYVGLCEGDRKKDDPPHGPGVHVYEPIMVDKDGNPYSKSRKYCERCCPVCRKEKIES